MPKVKKSKNHAKAAIKAAKKAAQTQKLIEEMRKKVAAAKAAKAKSGTAKGHKTTMRPLDKMTVGKLEYCLYQVWKGYRIARGKNEVEKMKHYAAGIDKFKNELARRGVKDKHGKDYTKHALPFPGKPKIPRYADGVWLKAKGGGVTVISPWKPVK